MSQNYTRRSMGMLATADRVYAATTGTVTILQFTAPITAQYGAQLGAAVGTGSPTIAFAVSWTDPDVGPITSTPGTNGAVVPGLRWSVHQPLSVLGGTTVTLTGTASQTTPVYWMGFVNGELI